MAARPFAVRAARAFGALIAACALEACSHDAPSSELEPAQPKPAEAGVALALAHPFGDHMVLQREQPAPIWGSGPSGAHVRVTLAARTSTADIGVDGRWRVVLDPLAAGGPFELTVSADGATLRVHDVLVGEVWLCAGQSNMGMRVRQAENLARELRDADHPHLRIFTVDKEYPLQPAIDVNGAWVVSSRATIETVSATAYFFGRDLEAALDVPVGLIVSAVGGTGIESWTPRAAQDGVVELQALLAKVDALYAERSEFYEKTGSPEFYRRQYELSLARWEAQRKDPSAGEAGRRPKLIRHPLWSKNHPGNLYNGMIAPLFDYGIAGVLWYQGEYNTGTSLETREAVEPGLYAVQLTTLIESWRAQWGRALPFEIVQLTGWLAPTSAPVQDHGWALVREQQARVAARVAGTGLAVTLDVGDPENIHPPQKQAVGDRLARLALRRTYGHEDVLDAGPFFAHMQREGNALALDFEHAEGLRTSDGAAPRTFALAGADHVWHTAEARIEGVRVVLTSRDVPEPVAVRYAWAANPRVNLCNAVGLPAAPFRTDDWPITLEDAPLPAHFQGEDE